MKILFIAKTLSLKDGQGRYARALINQLQHRYNLIILCSDVADFKKNKKNIEIHKLPSFYALYNLFFNFCCSLKLTKYLNKVDIIHCLSDFPYCVLFDFIPTKKKIFITVHGTYGVMPLRNRLNSYLLKKSYKKAKAVICVSSFTKNAILQKVKLDNLIVINNGVNYKKWQTKPLGKFPYKSILSVGALKRRKGYHISIPSIAKVKEKYPDIRYYIVGNQKNKRYFRYLKKLVKKNNLQNNVIFLENLLDKDLISLYHKVDLFLLTPINIHDNFEGFGLVYLEANACGLPVIGTYNCGAEDAIKSGFNGILVPQNNINATAEAILRILNNQSLAQKLGANGRKLAQEMDWAKIVKKYIELYKN